jgi:purine-nucleoside phosphorylase
MLNQINEAVDFIQNEVNFKPEIGIILGTGLGGLINKIEISHEIDYSKIPHFPLSTVESHSGKLIFGTIKGKNVVVMQGRFHYYEGYDMSQVVFPVRVMKYLGIDKLFVSNACGGLNNNMDAGDLFIIKDHINLFPTNPLIGKNIDELGPRFPDMMYPYDLDIVAQAEAILNENNTPYHKGVYAGLTGPMLETPAEYKYLSIIGADVVGMSTVPEIIAAKHMGIPCFAASIITDICTPEKLKEVNLQEIIETAMKAEPKLTALFSELIARN